MARSWSDKDVLTREKALALLERMRRNPVLFVEHVLGVKLWGKQREIFEDVFVHPRVAVRSCHASGKSFCAACIAVTYVHLFRPCAVVTTAPTSRQVFTVIWQEIRRLVRRAKRPLGSEPLSTIYRVFDDAYAIGVSTDDPDRLQGIHAPNILVIVDEAPGLPEEMFDAIEGLLASGDSRLLLLGNPSSMSGYFYRVFNDPAFGKGWKLHAISAFDTPNVREKRVVVPGLVTWEWVQQRKEIWGEDHPLYQIRVLGQFPTQEYGNLVVPPSLIEKSRNLDLGEPSGPVILGVDIADMGGDETVVAVRHGPYLTHLHAWSDVDLVTSCRRILDIAHRHRAKEIRIDRVGVGAGAYSFLKQAAPEGVAVVGVDVRESPREPDKYHDFRAELWYGFRIAMQEGRVSFARLKDPEADVLFGQLMYPTFSPTNQGLIRVESKLEMRKRGLRSPDRAEAVIIAFAESVQHGLVTPPSEEHLASMRKEPTIVAGEHVMEGEPPWRAERTNLRDVL